MNDWPQHGEKQHSEGCERGCPGWDFPPLLLLLMAAPEFQVTPGAASSQTIWQLLLEALLTLSSQKEMGYRSFHQDLPAWHIQTAAG